MSKRKRVRKSAILLLLFVVASAAVVYFGFIRMPGASTNIIRRYDHVDSEGYALQRHVTFLAGKVGVRNNSNPGSLTQSAAYIRSEFHRYGLQTEKHTYTFKGRKYTNIIGTIPGSDDKDSIILVGAHYDSAHSSPGANDNASGVASMLQISRQLVTSKPKRTIRFVAFTNEEPPYFRGEGMGSYQYAKLCADRKDKLSAVIILETIGYYSDKPGSQKYPGPLQAIYPDKGNFVAFVGNAGSRNLVAKVKASFNRSVDFPNEAAALPERIPGVGNSDHASFWKFGYQAVMVTDTAMFRYPYYHTTRDTKDKLDYKNLQKVTNGITGVVADLAGCEEIANNR